MKIPYFDHELEELLVAIANKKRGWQDKAPDAARRAIYRIADLENTWSVIRDRHKELTAIIEEADDSLWRG